MTPQSRTRTQAHSRPAGFTLIELMIVILIIAILIALAFPAINAVLRNARIASAKAEMTQIGTSIADFKTEYNKVPASSITFAATGNPQPAPTRAILRSMFPQINFSVIAADIEKAGLADASADKTLQGPEALVFFLGGIRKDTDGDGILQDDEKELTGFSKNPSNPFAQPTAGSSRIGPFFEFDVNRLVDVDGDGLLEYKDNLPDQTLPFLYVSTTGTGSYAAGDVAGFHSNAVPTGWTPYQSAAGSFYNPTSYQLISPGILHEYGDGGVVNEDKPPGTLDADNLTNFVEGELEDLGG